jgi:hypothetical protein
LCGTSFRYYVPLFGLFEQSVIIALLLLFCLFLIGSRSGLVATLPVFMLAYILILKKASSLEMPITTIMIVALHFIGLYYFGSLVELVESLPRLFELAEVLSNEGFNEISSAAVRSACILVGVPGTRLITCLFVA